ncbi:MAG: type II secretion system GspH family protein [Candidatus Pacebacteria bacterium]|nr:type II secretion system GspH family protein [Candidatus Paceibacterota bacterium]
MSKVNCQKGFTLIEFLIYIGIVVFLMSSLTFISLNVLRVRAKINAIDRVSRNTEMAMNTITNMVQNAKSVNSAGGSLNLEIYQSHNDPTVFTLSDGKIMMSRGGRVAVPITTEGVEVTDLTFTNPTSRMVEIEITMRNVNPQNLFYYEFEGTFNTKENVRHSN